MPRHRKTPEMRQRTNTPDVGELAPPPDVEAELLESTEVPKPPRGLLKSTRDSWDRFFRSVARQVTILSLDLDLLERLWILYDERARAQMQLRRPLRDAEGKKIRSDSRVVEGSQGQMRASPFYMVISRLDAEIRQLEDRTAKHMKARLNLGLVVGGDDPRNKPDEPTRPDVTDAPDDEPRSDPRLYVVGRNAG